MKKLFKTFMHTPMYEQETVFFSAGKIGYQIEMLISDLEKMVPIRKCDLLAK